LRRRTPVVFPGERLAEEVKILESRLYILELAHRASKRRQSIELEFEIQQLLISFLALERLLGKGIAPLLISR